MTDSTYIYYGDRTWTQLCCT